VGRPVWMDFLLWNTGDHEVTLTVPGVEVDEKADSPVTLPPEHIFSGPNYQALHIEGNTWRYRPDEVSRPPASGKVPPLVLGPHACVGYRMELTELYPILKRAGEYQLTWMPYGGIIRSNTVTLKVTRLKQAVIVTELGKMRVRLFYDKAPRHVANFLELAERGFYDGTTFHRVINGILIQGGDPRGDGTGIRDDGVLIPAEFNDVPFDVGTVGMARKPSDPNSASCQFFICLTRLKELDGKWTAFGQLADPASIEVAKRIGAVKTYPYSDRPIRPIYIRTITVEDAPERPEPMPAQPTTTTRPSITTQPSR